MRTTETILGMLRKRGQEQKPLERIYRLLCNQNLLLTAYGNIAPNSGALTAGSDPTDTIDGMNIDRIDQVITALKQGTFRWKPVRRVHIDKANGKKRPLGIPIYHSYCTSYKRSWGFMYF